MKNKGRKHIASCDSSCGCANGKGWLVFLTRPETSMAKGKISGFNSQKSFYKTKMNKRIRGYQKTSKVQNQYFEEYDWATTYYS